jgi:L-threonate 2-dehydrogenase
MDLESAEPVGIIGLGAIGLGVAKSLLRAGITTHGCDLNVDAVAEFESAGGIAQATPAELGRHARIIFLFVVNAAQARDVLFGEGGLTQSNNAAIVVCCVTMAPADVIAINTELQALGVSMVDAPTSGGVANAAAGKTKFMVSGAPDDVNAVNFALEAVADTVFRIGDEVGQGATVKTVHQLLAGVHIAAAMEALALGIKMGIDPQTLYDVVTGCAGNSWMFENRVPHVLGDDYTPLSAVDIFVKDLGLVLDTGLKQRFPLPLAAAAHQQFLAASAAGYGREDDAAVIKVYRDLANLKLPSKKA